MSAEGKYGAIAALMGVLAISAAKSGSKSNESAPKVEEGNGIWVPESDRDAVIKMINKAASKEYYIDANGFVREVPGAVENLSKSSTYSSVLDRLINGNNKVVIGVNDGGYHMELKLLQCKKRGSSKRKSNKKGEHHEY